MSSKTVERVVHVPIELVGAITGRRYRFRELIQHRPHLGSVWVATHGWENFIMKDVPEGIFDVFSQKIWPRLRQKPSTLLRLPVDVAREQKTLVYQFMKDDFLNVVRFNISMRARRQILKAALQGIADLHDRDIVHLDVKPNNILVDYEDHGAATTVEQVQIIDFENAVHLPGKQCIRGLLAGNDNWRSIEAHFRGELTKPTDMFSFGLVCLYAKLDRIICGHDEDFEKHESQGALPFAIRLQRLVSYFGDTEGLNGLMKHVGDEETNRQILSSLWDERNEYGYKPFSEWPEAKHDETFTDLIMRLMNLDPAKRITASQALAHPWFSSIPMAA